MIIYSQNMAAKLMLLGYKLIKIEENKNNLDFNVFFFKDCIKLTNDINQIKNEEKSKNELHKGKKL